MNDLNTMVDPDRRWNGLRIYTDQDLYECFHFGTWSEEAPEFEDCLGDMAFSFDAVVDRFDGGLELAPGTTTWVIDCNWKVAPEQFADDMYHGRRRGSLCLVRPVRRGRGSGQVAVGQGTTPERFLAFWLRAGRLAAVAGLDEPKAVRAARALLDAEAAPAPEVLADPSTDLGAPARGLVRPRPASVPAQ